MLRDQRGKPGKSDSMSIMTTIRKGLAPAAVSLALLGLASAQVAQAATGSAARPAAPGLHATARIGLGSSSGIFSDVFTQAPNGAVFYSRGSVVYVVDGNLAPKIALHAGKNVLALAANASELFVQTGLTVTGYSRSNGAVLRHWTLTSPVTPITSAGLYAVGSTLWSWTDWATDRTGFEYAKVNRIAVTGSAVHVVAREAFPGDMAADTTGLYFESVRGSSDYLNHVKPSGSLRSAHVSNGDVDAPLALAAGRVDLLTFSTQLHVTSFSPTTLAELSSKQVSANDRDIAGTGLGLLVLAQPCSHLTCSSSTVSKLDASTGSATGTLTVPYTYLLLPGPFGAVIEVSHGKVYLVRIGP